ncbi:MAG: tRNA preQ1(34) S-adenosylmethionine ribosyltransferase-isomerase QueA [Deltaproteobacteria bacterium]|nr:tRNA preQ1(34) S-adenosylmethionine ribosyltransferase-isomerase QueA [Deltaproteobacteria bacterium]
MELKEFMYELPRSLIADFPKEDRAEARLMVIERATGRISHSVFANLCEILRAGDLLVLNDSKVFPARLRGRKESGGKVEILLLEPFPWWEGFWIALIDAAKKPKPGSRIILSSDVWAEMIGDMGKGRYGIRFHYQGTFAELLEKLGEPPLPPYVRRTRDPASLDRERYQTIYAVHPGAIAAPTAGFHFTAELFSHLEARGIDKTFLTLHVGAGTFQPVREEIVECHRMEGERYRLSEEAANRIAQAKREERRIIAVGSTTTRVLESVARRKGQVEADEGITRLYIHPGEPFYAIDGLITNFHLPGSTPLVLVAAFAGLDLVRRAYDEAVRTEYRFYSYGDAMLVL